MRTPYTLLLLLAALLVPLTGCDSAEGSEEDPNTAGETNVLGLWKYTDAGEENFLRIGQAVWSETEFYDEEACWQSESWTVERLAPLEYRIAVGESETLIALEPLDADRMRATFTYVDEEEEGTVVMERQEDRTFEPICTG
jgi:hypothetical protein